MSRLTITFRPDPDPSDEAGYLTVEVQSETFSGKGSCWASPSQMQEFSNQLQIYPIEDRNSVTLECGFNNLEHDDLTCRIAIRPADGRGNLRVEAEVSDHTDQWSRVRLAFGANYADLARFHQAMVAMLAGINPSATLIGFS